MAKSKAETIYESRITEDYLVQQTNAARQSDSHRAHKGRISDFDALYRGDFSALFPNETSIPEMPLVENKVKNATHDLARLASEAKGTPVFMRQAESEKAKKEAAVRSVIADTLWRMGGGPKIERNEYIDMEVTGYAAVAAYYNDSSDYPIFMRLDPRLCYPDVQNGTLVSMLYAEELKERVAAWLWPEAGLNADPKNDATVLAILYYDKDETVQAICGLKGKSGVANSATITDRWVHGIGCPPVAFEALPSADGTYHGLFDQLGGPLMARNKTVRLLVDYLESMAHAPFESKNVLNSDDEPGPNTVYQHDPNSEQSFLRRVAPAAPAGSVFGLLQYMDSQESAEAIQPPARVGIVSQSIASGSFVTSTQGTLSSVVKELQDSVASLREQLGVIAMKIDEKWCNKEKPLWRSIGNKQTYTPAEDINGWYHHTIQYGASAGLNRSEADVRVLQHLGAKLISNELAREQLDYIDDTTVEQARIDREQLSNVLFQRFVADPNTPVSALAEAITEMAKGKSLVEVVEKIIPTLQQAEQQAQQNAAAKAGTGEATPPAEQQQALQAGAGAEATSQLVGGVQFAPSPLQQQIVRNPL